MHANSLWINTKDYFCLFLTAFIVQLHNSYYICIRVFREIFLLSVNLCVHKLIVLVPHNIHVRGIQRVMPLGHS